MDDLRQKFSQGLEWLKSNPLIVCSWIFYSILFLVVWGLFVILIYNIQDVSSYSRMLAKTASDASLVVLPCLLFRSKWKILIFPYVIFWGLVIFVNILYNRFFDDFVPSSFYNFSIPFNKAAVNGAVSTLKWNDSFIVLLAFLPLGVACLIGFKKFFSFNATKYEFCAEVIILVVSWTLMLNYSYGKADRYVENLSWTRWYEIVFPKEEVGNYWKVSYDWLNFSGYLYRCFIESRDIKIKLTDDQKREIWEYFERKKKVNSLPADSLNVRCPENLIMIVVESWPTAALHNKYSTEIAPFITSLISDETVVATSAKVLSKYGHSSDAQFTYITGLLPLRNEAVVVDHALNDYPSLPKALGGNSIEIIGEDSKLWNHHLTTLGYGFKKLIDKVGDIDEINGDSLIFQRAKTEITSISRPFMLVITTISMHNPYNFKAVEPHLKAQIEGIVSPDKREYYQRMNLLDRQLESFIKFLKEKDLYDTSLIVIMGDHQVLHGEGMDDLMSPYVPLIILNSTIHEVRKRNVTQADVFPTILDIMGKDYRFRNLNYNGFGSSIFEDTDKVLTPEDYRISEWMIRSQY